MSANFEDVAGGNIKARLMQSFGDQRIGLDRRRGF